MSAAFPLPPFPAVRLGLLAALNWDALRRAAHFAPLQGVQRAALVCLSGAECGNFSGPPFLSGAGGLAALNGRSLLFDGAWPVRGRSSQLCLAGPPWAEHGRGLPVFPQPHVCGLFHLLP